MRIYSQEPTNWQDLQIKVGEVFAGLGCNVTIEKTIQLVRGHVNVDVFVEDNTASPILTYISECKFWETEIPKSVVHSFRTVISDSGANCGFLISKKGFQVGAYEAADKTNVYLMNWTEFIEVFEDRWLISMINKLHNIGAPIRDYCSPLACLDMIELEEIAGDEKRKYEDIVEEFWLISTFSSKDSYLEVGTGKYVKSNVLSQINYIIDKFLNPLKITSYADYFSTMIDICRSGTDKIDSIVGKVRR